MRISSQILENTGTGARPKQNHSGSTTRNMASDVLKGTRWAMPYVEGLVARPQADGPAFRSTVFASIEHSAVSNSRHPPASAGFTDSV